MRLSTCVLKKIARSKVPPSLQPAFNLHAISEFPLTLLKMVTVICSIIPATRVGALRLK